jgi:multicomponent Na+:H+ antiporter subunit E
MRASILTWLVLLFVVWWALAEPRGGWWRAAAAGVGIGLALRLLLPSATGDARVQPLAFLAFVPYFAWQSIQGGWDVSRRALSPSLPLDPQMVPFRLSLPPGAPRVFMTNALSLLPGTFGADLRDDELVVHLLTGGPAAETRVRDLEARVGRVFGVTVS